MVDDEVKTLQQMAGKAKLTSANFGLARLVPIKDQPRPFSPRSRKISL
jgi:hypothetical protein